MWGLKRGNGSRGQSSPIAVVLVFGLVIASTTIVVIAGGSAIQDTRSQLGMASAENAMTQLDSQASLVALGNSGAQRVNVENSNRYRVDGGAGWMNISYSNSTGTTTINNATLGEVRYEGDNGEQVAYQGGGVWRSYNGNDSVMISPPEFHYRESTLTLPMVTINNNGSFDQSAFIRRNNTTQHFPNETTQNPLSDGEVTIEVKSQYHHGWATYFEERTDGSVDHKPNKNRVAVTLTVPVTVEFENGVSATTPGSSSISPSSNFNGSTRTGVDAPSVSRRVDEAIDDCVPVSSTSCDSLSSELPSSGSTIGAGTYYHNGDYEIPEGSEFNTSSGDINIVIEGGDLGFGGVGGPSNEDHSVTGSGNVTFYLKGDVDIGGNAGVNNAGDPSDLFLLMHSDSDTFDLQGTDEFNGYVYAPSVDLTINGGGAPANNINGGIVVSTATGTGGGSLMHTGPAGRDLNFRSADDITYLHVSENELNVTG